MSIHRIASTASQLMAQARADTGIDIHDTEVDEALQRLLQSLNTEAELNAAGAIGMEQRISRILRNRLRMQRDIAAHPEILDQQIIRPLILTGAGRTGSTKLHKLLAAGGDFIHLTFWQGHSLSLRSGDRHEDPAPRIREADDYVRWFDTHSPQAKTIHAFETHEPEEETLIVEHGCFGLYMMAFAFVPSFIQWTAQRLSEHNAFLKRGLQYLQWQFHDGDTRSEKRRWLLKTPLHFGMEPLLAQTFPDADFVVTHRDPMTTLASQASLVDYYYRAYSDAARQPVLGQMMLEGQTVGMQAFLFGRETCPQLHTFDVAYPAVTTDALAVAEAIYAHAGLPAIGAKARTAMQQWERNNAQHKHGAHSYSLDTYALDTETVQDRFRPYRERFGAYF